MKIISYFDSKTSRGREFIRYQLSKSENRFALRVLRCKLFSDDVASGELYAEEFAEESDAEAAYRKRISRATSLSPDELIAKPIPASLLGGFR